MRYFLKKTVALLVTLLVAAFLTFLAFEVIPSDAAMAKLSIDATEEEINALREAMGLNRSLPVRYGDFLLGAVRGDFGESTQYGLPVTELLSKRFGVTLGLALLSFVLIIGISVPFGIFTARAKTKTGEGLTAFFTQTMMAVPAFFLGMLITLLFGIVLRWFTPGAYVPAGEDFIGFLKFMIFPAIAVAVPKIGMSVRFLQSSLKEQLHSDYVRTARSKGCSKSRVLWRHVLRNALVPVVTFLTMVMAEILAGSIVIEQVFNLSGIGRLLAVSIASRDFPVVRAIVLYTTAVVVLLNYGADLLCRYLDPRIKEL
ncbi:MAG: ABC transporter permease [Lachnospiraceae bacterium]|nr:ABC transporter permease [Lachnospiraceae bacterium]